MSPALDGWYPTATLREKWTGRREREREGGGGMQREVEVFRWEQPDGADGPV